MANDYMKKCSASSVIGNKLTKAAPILSPQSERLSWDNKLGMATCPCNPAPGRLRQEDCNEFEANLGYRLRPYLTELKRKQMLSRVGEGRNPIYRWQEGRTQEAAVSVEDPQKTEERALCGPAGPLLSPPRRSPP